MNLLRSLWGYFRWHYSTALVDMFFIERNYLWAIGHIFSVSVLLRTLFVPWHRMAEHTTSFFHGPLEFIADLFLNLILRLMGLIVRTTLLLLALICAFVSVVIFFGSTVLWLFLPYVIFALISNGINLLFV